MKKSAIDRMKELPETFSLAHLCRHSGMSQREASVYLNRWKSAGLVDPAGERAAIYFNKLKIPVVSGEHRATALLQKYPSALLCGESVLHMAGWVTQIPSRKTVAVLSRPSFVIIDGFEIRGKCKSWFDDVFIEIGRGLLKNITPAIALADLYQTPGSWIPDADDLYIDDAELPSVHAAFELFGLPLPEHLMLPGVSDHEKPRSKPPRF